MAGMVFGAPGQSGQHAGPPSDFGDFSGHVRTDEDMLFINTVAEFVRVNSECKQLRAAFTTQQALLRQSLLENKEIERQNVELRNLMGFSRSLDSVPQLSAYSSPASSSMDWAAPGAAGQEASNGAWGSPPTGLNLSLPPDLLALIAEVQLRNPGPSGITAPHVDHRSLEHPLPDFAGERRRVPEIAPELPEAALEKPLEPDELQRGPRRGEEPEALMVQNLPLRFTREDLLQVWPADRCQYDFIYLPYNVKRRRITGYVFVNFVSGHAAAAFFDRWQGQRMPGYWNQGKPLVVVRADVHGLEANLRHFVQSSGITNEKYWPVVFRGAERVKMKEALDELGLLYGLGDPGERAWPDADNAEEGAQRSRVSGEHSVSDARLVGAFDQQVTRR